MEKKNWQIVNSCAIEATYNKWLSILRAQDQISPDKYLSTLSYFTEIINHRVKISSNDTHYAYGYVDQDNQAEVLVHLVHARTAMTEGGWLKVLSTRISPAFDPELNDDLDDEAFSHLTFQISELAAESLSFCIEFAKQKEIPKLKYYASNQVDFSILRELAHDLKSSSAAGELKVSIDRKGNWVEVNL